MAKGVEDTAFYRWSRLTSLTEVGADPAIFAVSPVEFPCSATAPADRATTLDDHADHSRHQAG